MRDDPTGLVTSHVNEVEEFTETALQLVALREISRIEAHAVAANSGLEQTVVGFYGSSDGIADGIQPDYFLFLESVNTSLTASDLSQVDSHLLTVISVQTADRVSFHCGAPLSGEMTSMCTWVDGNVFGVVEGSASVGAAATTAAAEQARTIAEH